MSQYNLLFESPPWLIGIGVLMGFLYAAGLYYKYKGPWGQNLNRFLAVLRFLLITQLTLLLFGPLIRMIKNTYEAPAIVFAIDNSISISEVVDSAKQVEFKQQLETLRKNLENAGYNTEIQTLENPLPRTNIVEINYSAKTTNLYALLNKIRNNYESRNLAEIILVSDGLINRGMNPVYQDYPFKILTIGLGDTIRHPDINLNALLYNKIAYQGNKFPLVAELFTSGLIGKVIDINILNKGRIVTSKQVKITQDEQFDRVHFLLEAKEKGIQRYVVHAKPAEGEFITANNAKEAFIDIIEGKLKILIAAPAPHPDIKALSSAIEKNQNYDVHLMIPGISPFKNDKYDAVILHGIPDLHGRFGALLNDIKNKNIPVWFIVSNQSDLRQFNKINGLVQLQNLTNQKDQAFPLFNKDFKIFDYKENYSNRLSIFPPVVVPFTKINVRPGSEVMLYQKIGNIVTTKPLLVLAQQDNLRRAVLLGEGIWKWRLQEYTKDKDFIAFDGLVSKIIQFLSTKSDKRKFRVYPLKNEFVSSEPVIFETEIYNDIYENIYGYKIDLTIKNEVGETMGYSYVTSETNSKYQINSLDNGIYSYVAKSNVNGKTIRTKGRFTIKDLQIEATRLRADFSMLEALATKTGGKFYTSDELDKMEREMIKEKPKSKIYTTEDYLAIINMKWGFFILILLTSLEWFLRKYYGSY